MKKKITAIIGAVVLTLAMACGEAEPASVPAGVEVGDDSNLAQSSGFSNNNSSKASASESTNEAANDNSKILGTWCGENIFILWYTFKEDGTFDFAADGGAQDVGTYEFDGTTITLNFSAGEYTDTMTYTDRGLRDSSGTLYAFGDTPAYGDMDINGVWQKDKLFDTWIVIREWGQEWSMYNYNGEEAVKGTVALDGDYFALIDETGETYAKIMLLDSESMMEEMYQETYTRVEDLPEKFPGQLADEVGFGAIEGDWFYQTSSPDNTEDYQNIAYVSVYSDGTYDITWLQDESEATGTILLQETETPDGVKGVEYYFYEGGNNLWITAIANEDDPDVITTSQDGTSRLYINVGEGD